MEKCSTKRFKFSHELEKGKEEEQFDRNSIQPNPEKSSGWLEYWGKDVVALIGQHLLYHHTWVNFMCSSPFAYKACTEPGLNQRPRWDIIYDQQQNRLVRWKFESTKGHYNFKTACLYVTITDPAAIFITHMNDGGARIPEKPCRLVFDLDGGPIKCRKIAQNCLVKTSGGPWIWLDHGDLNNLCPYIDGNGTLLFGIVPPCPRDEIDFDPDLDSIFCPGLRNLNRCVYMQSQDKVEKIESELKFFIYHLARMMK